MRRGAIVPAAASANLGLIIAIRYNTVSATMYYLEGHYENDRHQTSRRFVG